MKIVLAVAVIIFLSFVPVFKADAKSYWLRGGLIGLGVGVAGGAVMGYGVGRGMDSDDMRCKSGCKTGMITLGALGLGAVGFGVGALIGSAFKKEDMNSSEARLLEVRRDSFLSPEFIIDPNSGTYGLGISAEF